MIDTIICGDNAAVLAGFPDACIDLTVTSPPYDNLRTYNGYSWDFEEVARQLYRVTKPSGVVVWVVADEMLDGSETGTSFKQALYFKECGFGLHDTMIYQRFARYPDASRYRNDFEYMFVLSKGKPITYNKIEDRRNLKSGSLRGTERKTSDALVANRTNRKRKEYGDRGNVWFYSCGAGSSSEDVYAYQHPAIFPEALAKDHILSWSNPGDLVLDPFVGSGTTCKMAKELGRHWIGIDISEEYCQLARRRVAGANVPLFTEAS